MIQKEKTLNNLMLLKKMNQYSKTFLKRKPYVEAGWSEV